MRRSISGGHHKDLAKGLEWTAPPVEAAADFLRIRASQAAELRRAAQRLQLLEQAFNTASTQPPDNLDNLIIADKSLCNGHQL